ncbi:MAG: hypothetical protein COX79_02250 [Candidatus Levybacteria bacterium CG_4_10_14_0_2_um_filter_36_16]|nr:MAG: hypothetical protein AUK12_00765 [Candidatus Levybacteria bacterium CG2_30_37_29]PIZ97444.1 MAG: hypothetical protein COX79_02250 [Candidatus Levybacteria bacterium CG_4_10_14_0_2_um_filter_36_16]
MLTKDDLKQIKNVVQDAIQPVDFRLSRIEGKVDDLTIDVSEVKSDVKILKEDTADLKLETKAIHKIIEIQSLEHEKRIERLEENVGISN